MEYEAARLLVARASAAAGGVTLDDRTAEAIAAVVTRLDGLPLAIELAAGKLRSMSLPNLARTLEHRLDLLAGGDRMAPPRQQSLEAAISWSFELLSSLERRLLERLAVFPGSFDAPAAEAVGADQKSEREAVLPRLMQLVDKSLVSAELGDQTRYRLLTTVREFAIDRARESGELESAASCHGNHFADLADEVFWHLVGPELGAWLDRARLDQANFHAALHQSLDSGVGDLALRLASALSMYWFRTGQLREWHELLARALALAGPSSRWRARGLVAQAWLSLSAGEPEAFRHACEAAAVCEEADAALLSLALAALAQSQIARDELDEAGATICRAQEVLPDSRFAESRHILEQLMGETEFRRGNLDAALAHLRRSRDLYRDLRVNLDAGWALVRLAEVALVAGHPEEAMEAATDAVKDFRARGDPRGLAAAFVLLGRTYAARRDAEHARELLLEALELAREWEYPVELGKARSALDELELTNV
jgi:tetratricopeptide (TPR) repeat protein